MKRSFRFCVGLALGVLPYGCQGKTISADESTPQAPVQPGAAGTAGTASPTFLPGGSPESADQLRVDIEIAGMAVASRTLACGQCVDIGVAVRGGRPPYSYSWSNAALTGKGPHRVCPRGPTDYTVRVTDTPLQGEIRRASLQADARLHVDVEQCASMPEPGPGSGVGGKKDAGGTGVTIPPPPTTRHDAGRTPPVDAGPSRHDASPPPPADGGSQHRVCPCSNEVSWTDKYFSDASFENLSAPTRVSCSGTPTNTLISSAGAGSAPDGMFYLGLSVPTSESETLRQPLRAGQRYWLSWDMASTSQITALTGIPLGAVEISGATAPCAAAQLIGSQSFRPTDWGGWIHVCAEFVPTRDYPYVVITARVANGYGTGFVSIDAVRMAPYTPSPTDYLWDNCAALPLDMPFP